MKPSGTGIGDVAVPGGSLAVEVISSATEPVLAIHGISSQRKLWNCLRAADPGISLIAPDLRGRGDSIAVTPAALPVVFRDRLARVDRRWSSVRDYARFFVSTTAPLLDQADPLLLDYLGHDLANGAVRLSADALIADSTDIFFGKATWRNVSVPTRLLAAQWSRGRDSAPVYGDGALRTFEQELSTLVAVRRLNGADHAASIMTAAGAAATADLIAAALTER